LIGKNRKRFFRYRACVRGGKKRGFCRLPCRVATPKSDFFDTAPAFAAAKSVVFAACHGA